MSCIDDSNDTHGMDTDDDEGERGIACMFSRHAASPDVSRVRSL